MYTTVNPEGQLNNYAIEPATYVASYPTPSEQFRYLQQGALSLFLVSALCFIAIGVS